MAMRILRSANNERIIPVLVLSTFLVTNFFSIGVVWAETVEMKYDPAHPLHAPKVTNGISYQYDRNGNLENNGERVLSWNADNLPIKIVKGGVEVNLFYDADGRRIVKQIGQDRTNRTIYVNQYYQLQGTSDQQLATRYYFVGDRRIASQVTSNQPPVTSYYHQDHLGSTTLATNQDSQPTSKALSYFPYGQVTSNQQPVTSNYLFTGQELDDETELYNYQARQYDARGGYFISADSLVGDPEASDFLDRYGYGQNNPLTFRDTSGLQAEDVSGWPFFKTIAVSPGEEPKLERTKKSITRALSLLDPTTAAAVKSPIFLVEQVIIGSGSFKAGVAWATTETGERVAQIQLARGFLDVGRQPHWVLHEVGHVLEEKKGDLSRQLAFKEALATRYSYEGGPSLTYGFYDVLEYFEQAKASGYGYALKYLESPGELRLDEAFAEAFAFYTEGSEVLSYTPALVEYFNKLLGLDKKFPVLVLPLPTELRVQTKQQIYHEHQIPE